jgi:type II secretory pathway pseudopilin PulG
VIEVLTVLVLTGLLAAVAGMSMVPWVEGYIGAKARVRAAQQAQGAMDRITKEIQSITNQAAFTAGSASTMTYDSPATGAGTVLSWSGAAGAPLMLAGRTLVDDVQSFRLWYLYWDGTGKHSNTTLNASTTGIGMALKLTIATNTVFNTEVYIRP